MPLPSEVHSTTSTFLVAIDAAVPGLVEGLYLVGSFGFGEFIPERSDVGFVAVLAKRPDGTVLEVLAAAHRCRAPAASTPVLRRHPCDA